MAWGVAGRLPSGRRGYGYLALMGSTAFLPRVLPVNCPGGWPPNLPTHVGMPVRVNVVALLLLLLLPRAAARYAAMLGATTEWSKWEGITFDSKRRRLYTAMSELDQVRRVEEHATGDERGAQGGPTSMECTRHVAPAAPAHPAMGLVRVACKHSATTPPGGTYSCTFMLWTSQGCLPEPSRFGGLDHVRLPANK